MTLILRAQIVHLRRTPHRHRDGMADARKFRLPLSLALVSVSTKLSIAAVVGAALLVAVAVPTNHHGEGQRPMTAAEKTRGVAAIAAAASSAEMAPTIVEAPHHNAAGRNLEHRGRPAIGSRTEPGTEAGTTPGPQTATEPGAEPARGSGRHTAKIPSTIIGSDLDAPMTPALGSMASSVPQETNNSAVSAVPAEPKSPAAHEEPPQPTVWSDAEVIAALRECVKLLSPIAADVEVSAPLRHEDCGTPAPVLLHRIGSGNNAITVNPPATLNCAMVAHLHQWVERTLQPAARDMLASPITQLHQASGYSCRTRIGSAFNADKLSEHAKANAVDIAGFRTADGRSIEVSQSWGPTVRERRDAEKRATTQAKEAAQAAPETARQTGKGTATTDSSAKGRRAKGKDNVTAETAELQRLGRGAANHKIPIPDTQPQASQKTVEAAFLRRLHAGACGVFGTVLGPEANAAHHDHFHFDLAARKHGALCE
jgi:hypothetical protein